MNINISLTEDEMEMVMSQSATFRYIVTRTLGNAQVDLGKMVKPTEAQLMDQLRTYVRNNFGSNSKIAGIKYVRQWAADNRNNLSFATYESLYGLANAKRFVEDLIQW